MHIYSSVRSAPSGRGLKRIKRTVGEGDACIHNLYCSRLNEYAQVVYIEGYRWLRLGYGRIHNIWGKRSEYVIPPTEELRLTSLYPCESYHQHPKYKLTSCDDRESGGDSDVLHRRGVYPAAASLGVNLVVKQRNELQT